MQREQVEERIKRLCDNHKSQLHRRGWAIDAINVYGGGGGVSVSLSFCPLLGEDRSDNPFARQVCDEYGLARLEQEVEALIRSLLLTPRQV